MNSFENVPLTPKARKELEKEVKNVSHLMYWLRLIRSRRVSSTENKLFQSALQHQLNAVSESDKRPMTLNEEAIKAYAAVITSEISSN